jgi:hypothetical protein
MSGWYRLDEGLAIGTIAGIFAVVFLFGIFFQLNKMFMPESPHLNLKETRRNLLPLCILTLLHTLIMPLVASPGLSICLYSLSIPFLLLYGFIYMGVVRMNRFLGAAAAIYTVNLLIQAVIAFLVWAHAQGG